MRISNAIPATEPGYSNRVVYLSEGIETIWICQ